MKKHPQLEALLKDPARMGDFRTFAESLPADELAELQAFLSARMEALSQDIWQARRNVRRLEQEIAILSEDRARLTTASRTLSSQLYGLFGRIYRDPKAALRACWVLDKQHGPDAVAATLKKQPARLGALRGWSLGSIFSILGRRKAITTAARLDYPALRSQLNQTRKLQNLLQTMMGEA